MNKVCNLSRIRIVSLLLYVLFCSQLCKTNSESVEEMNEHTERSKSEFVSDVSNISENKSTDDTETCDLGEPCGLPNPTQANLCYINSVCQLLAACFPQEIKRLGRGDPGSLQDRLYTVIQYINGEQTSSEGSENAVLEHLQDISLQTRECDDNHQNGGDPSAFLKILNQKLHFLSHQKLLEGYQISYSLNSSGQYERHKEVIDVSQDGFMVLLPFYHTPENHKETSYCFRNLDLFRPSFEKSYEECDAKHQFSLTAQGAWKSALSDLGDLSKKMQLGTVLLSDEIVNAYVKHVQEARAGTQPLDCHMLDVALQRLSFSYLQLVNRLPKGTKLVINNGMAQVIPEEYIYLSYGNGSNALYQKFELMGYVDAYGINCYEIAIGHYSINIKRGQQWYHVDDQCVARRNGISGDLKILKDDDARVIHGGARKFNAELMVYRAL